jgi:hypothetical protein
MPADEDFDVFATCREWYQYAQKPLPPANPDPGVHDEEFAREHINPLLHRMPKMMSQIFRSYPARAQAYHAEGLEHEGWFDADGWLVREWFEKLQGGLGSEVRVGTESKYHAGPSWDRAYHMYKEYGIQNGLYVPWEMKRALLAKAQPYLLRHGVDVWHAPDQMSAADIRANLGESRDAAIKLKWLNHYKTTTNYDAYLWQTEAERLPEAVAGRKAFFQADRLRRYEAAPEQALALYEAAMPKWREFLLDHIDFARIPNVAEDTYEAQMRYLRLIQGQRDTLVKPIVTGMAQMALVLPVPLHLASTYSDEQSKIIPIRSVRGPFEMIYFFDRTDLDQFREVLVDLTQGALRPRPLLSPQLKKWLTDRTLVMTRPRMRPEDILTGWTPLIPDDVILQVRERLGISRPQAPPPAPAEVAKQARPER